MRKFCLFFILLLSLFLSACIEDVDTLAEQESQSISIDVMVEEDLSIEEELIVEVEPPVEENIVPEVKYFETDEVINKFFVDYNAIAEVIISQQEINVGNIDTKATVYINDVNLEIVSASDVLYVSMSSSAENEDTKFYSIFRDVIKTMRVDLTDDDIKSAWRDIHDSGYLVDGYDFNGVGITYIPSKELSWGTSDVKVDLVFSLK